MLYFTLYYYKKTQFTRKLLTIKQNERKVWSRMYMQNVHRIILTCVIIMKFWYSLGGHSVHLFEKQNRIATRKPSVVDQI